MRLTSHNIIQKKRRKKLYMDYTSMIYKAYNEYFQIFKCNWLFNRKCKIVHNLCFNQIRICERNIFIIKYSAIKEIHDWWLSRRGWKRGELRKNECKFLSFILSIKTHRKNIIIYYFKGSDCQLSYDIRVFTRRTF